MWPAYAGTAGVGLRINRHIKRAWHDPPPRCRSNVPFLASIDTVKAVPKVACSPPLAGGDGVLPLAGGGSGQDRCKPRAWRAMKLTAWGITCWAAITRSPSFSRSSSSTRMINFPCLISRIASSICEKVWPCFYVGGSSVVNFRWTVNLSFNFTDVTCFFARLVNKVNPFKKGSCHRTARLRNATITVPQAQTPHPRIARDPDHSSR